MDTGEIALMQSAPLRISYLLPQFPVPSEAFAVSDIAALERLGHTVTVHTMKPRRRDEASRLKTSEVSSSVTVLRPTLRSVHRWPGLLWTSRRAAKRLIALVASSPRGSLATRLIALACIPRVLEIVTEIERVGSDVVHLFWSRHAGLVLAALQAEGAAVVRTAFVGAYDLEADDFLVDISLGTAQGIVSHAEANRSFAESRAPAGVPVEIVHRGIPLIPLESGQPRDPALWVTASALVPAKNVEAVIRAFAHARSRRVGLRLQVFGEGPDRARLEERATALGCGDAVTFMGHVARTALFEHMRSASVFALLSQKPSERLPNVLKEALWAGCAVIAARTEGIEELIPDDGLGHIVDPADSDGLEAAVKAVLSETEAAANERRLRAHQFIATRFSSDASMAQYVQLWNNLRETHSTAALRLPNALEKTA